VGSPEVVLAALKCPKSETDTEALGISRTLLLE